MVKQAMTTLIHDATRDISYASSAKSRAGAAMIRLLENSTGRLRLIRRAAGYEREMSLGRSFWQVVPERYGLQLRVIGGQLSNIPRAGPLVVIANHPFGILDGLMMGNLLHQTRGDFRILANSVFMKAEALRRVVLPISFDATKEAQRLNIATREDSLHYLGQGGVIGVFPGGTVSTSATPFSRPMDPAWRNFTAKMISKSGATVVPVYFAGQNSRLFQWASHLHSNLRLGLLIKEFRSRLDEPVDVVIGEPLAAGQLAALRGDPTQMMEFLRKSTYDLSPEPQRSYDLGYEFDEKYRSR